MAEQLSDLLHDSVDPVDVPSPNAYAIAARGRALRTRRRVGAVVAAAVAVGAVGLGGVVVGDLVDGESRSSDVANRGEDEPDARTEASRAYDERGAWTAGSEVTVGSTTVALGAPVGHVAQTSVGVVARVFLGDAGNRYVLVRPDGRTLDLSIPSSVVHVGGDINHPRVAWLEQVDDELVAHVWDVSADAEVGQVSQPVQGDEPLGGGEFVLVPRLDGDDVYFSGGDDLQFQANWADGGATVLPYTVHTVHEGIAVVLEDPRAEVSEWLVYDVAADRVLRRLGSQVVEATISPSGQQVLTIEYHEDGTTVSRLVPATGGAPVAVTGVGHFSAWTRAGGLVSLDNAKGALVRCDAEATCAREDLGEVGDGTDLLVADYLRVG